jgi:hypothetical protein
VEHAEVIAEQRHAVKTIFLGFLSDQQKSAGAIKKARRQGSPSTRIQFAIAP